MLKNGLQHQYNLSVQGGSETLKYFMSGSVEDREGVLPNESLGRKSVRGNFSFTPLRGMTLAWNNLLPDGRANPATLHQGMKVRRGTKYIVTKWFRERASA